ncbi:MAG: DUF4395 domain-containing protein [Chloroflexi bacterium]|nr:DUF4395 domain-containing protein [Chloroflexota bacterium]
MGIKSLACPMSFERIDKNVVRSSAVITAVIIALYSVLFLVSTTIVFILMLVVAGDYFVRVFTPLKLSPIGWLGRQVTSGLGMTPKPMDKAPKIFAVRVGLIFAASSVGLFFVDPAIAIGVGLALMAFNLLDGVPDICLGCYFYTYVSLPLLGQK